jgi:glyoxylase-like metal-dependent hydrolase (beta-lactamase superfamily II)
MRLTLHGGFGEKGRTCLGVESGGCRLLLDAGVKTSARGSDDYYPAITPAELGALDAIVVTHAHEDHVAALGWCLARGFCGRIWMTPQTQREMPTSVADYAESAHAALVRAAPIEALAVGSDALHVGPLRIATGRSGHVAGGVWCRIGDGRTSMLYCSDVAPGSPVFAMDPLPACNALVIDASYGDDGTDFARRATQVAAWIAAQPQGCVLPTPLYGRSLELLAVVPGPIALAPGVGEALRAQIESPRWLVDETVPALRDRLAAAMQWCTDDPLPRAALLCHDGMGIGGTSPAILAQARAQRHPTLFTGHVPAGSPGERLLADGLADWIRLPTHPTLPENVALAAGSAAATVLGHSCDGAALARLARHIPNLRAEAATGDRIDF